MVKSIIVFVFFVLSLNAIDYRAYDIGGNEITAQASVVIDGEQYTLLPFSYIDIKQDETNLDGDFSLLFGKVNGQKVLPIKLASNYKNQSIVVKVFKNATFITQTEEIYIDNDVKYYSINIERE